MSLGWEPIWREHGAAWELREPEPKVIDFAKQLKAAGATKVLDLGCGLGRHLLLFVAEGFDAHGVDVSPTAVETCRRRLNDAGLQAKVSQAPMTALQLPRGSFDAVLAWNVLYHATADQIEKTVRGVRDLLRDGGLLYATFISTADGQLARTRELLAAGEAEEVGPGTFVIPGDTATDKALPHHYSKEKEIRERFLAGFDVVSMEEDRGDGEDRDFQGNPYRSAHWHVLAQRKAP